jgi:hypothetical protein
MKNLHDVPMSRPFKPSIACEALIAIHPVSKGTIETTASSDSAVGRGFLSLYAILLSCLPYVVCGSLTSSYFRSNATGQEPRFLIDRRGYTIAV